jgi:hypothetical protein
LEPIGPELEDLPRVRLVAAGELRARRQERDDTEDV